MDNKINVNINSIDMWRCFEISNTTLEKGTIFKFFLLRSNFVHVDFECHKFHLSIPLLLNVKVDFRFVILQQLLSFCIWWKKQIIQNFENKKQRNIPRLNELDFFKKKMKYFFIKIYFFNNQFIFLSLINIEFFPIITFCFLEKKQKK